MPGRADRIGFVCALTLCAANLCGCFTGGAYQPFSNSAVLPFEQIPAPQTMSNGGSSGAIAISPGATQFPIYSSSNAVPGDVLVSNSTTTTEPGNGTNVPRSTSSLPDLTHIYGRMAQSDDRDRNPIIVIPGVLGSRLVDSQSGVVVWGEFGGNSIDPRSPWGASMIALPMAQGKGLGALTDSVRAVGTLDALDVRLLGIPFQINAYRDLLNALGLGGYRDAQVNQGDVDDGNQTLFQFAYDWRRDNVENARMLLQFILKKKAAVEKVRRTRYGNDVEPVRFDIVAHSMGGLVARYYLEYGESDLPEEGSTPSPNWSGAENVERLVVIGTPNAGSLDAIANLVQGETLSRFLPRYEAAILGTMPSLYQLLPRSRQNPVITEADRKGIDVMDPRVWAEYRWGLLDPRQHHVLADLLEEVGDAQERLQIAYDHLSKCLARAKAFHAALDAPASPPAGTTIHLIAGDAHPTVAQYRVDTRGTLTVTGVHAGDSRVTRASALMDERQTSSVKWSPRLVSPIKWDSVNFLFADHLGLTSDPGFTDNVLFLLLEAPRK